VTRLSRLALFRLCLPSFVRHAERGFRYAWTIGTWHFVVSVSSVSFQSIVLLLLRKTSASSRKLGATLSCFPLAAGYDVGDVFLDDAENQEIIRLWVADEVTHALAQRDIEAST